MKALNTIFSALVLGGALAVSGVSMAQEEPARDAASLSELLGLVKQGQAQEARENAERERRFSADKANQANALEQAKAERARQEQLSTTLEAKFEENELLVAAKQEQLKERLGSLTELFGHLTAHLGNQLFQEQLPIGVLCRHQRHFYVGRQVTRCSGQVTEQLGQ